MELAGSVGADALLEFHRWLGASEMPGYYAAGDVTLCPGRFVEAFGLVPLESVVAGTPAICTKVGALREKAGVPGVSLFDYGDIAAAASAIVEAVIERFDVYEAQRTVRLRYSMDAMKAAYVKAITGDLPAKRRVTASWGGDGSGDAWRLAPWCYIEGDRIFHDYLGRFEQFPVLAAALSAGGSVDTDEPSLADELTRARSDGFVVRG